MSTRITQEVLEVVVLPVASVRVTQEVLEIVINTSAITGTGSVTARAWPAARGSVT